MANVRVTIETDDITLSKRGAKRDMDTPWNIADTILALARAYDKAMSASVMNWLRRRIGEEPE